jgi:hypothetical protein
VTQDQPIHPDPGEPGAAADHDEAQRAVLGLLLESAAQGPWSVDELARALGDEVRAADAVANLHAAGLVHRCHELVFLTRAAVRGLELADGM